jgi:capsular polysaccharide transport system permease protein
MVMAKLKEKLVSKQTELLTLSAFMQPKASKIISLKEEISALKKQLEEQTSILIGQNHNETLNTLLADYQWKELSLKFASAEYEAAQKAFELASLDVSKQQNILVILSPPTKPDVKSEPQILFNLMIAFMGLGLLYVIIKMAWLIIEEHTD